jgi:hypothetical protein
MALLTTCRGCSETNDYIHHEIIREILLVNDASITLSTMLLKHRFIHLVTSSFLPWNWFVACSKPRSQCFSRIQRRSADRISSNANKLSAVCLNPKSDMPILSLAWSRTMSQMPFFRIPLFLDLDEVRGLEHSQSLKKVIFTLWSFIVPIRSSRWQAQSALQL